MHVGLTLTFRRTFIRESPVRRYQAAAFKEGLWKEGISAARQGSNLTQQLQPTLPATTCHDGRHFPIRRHAVARW